VGRGVSATAPGAGRLACPLCGGAGRPAYVGRDLLCGLPGAWDYAECGACGSTWQAPLPDASEIPGLYPETYPVHQAESRWRPPGSFERAALRSRWGYRHLDVGPVGRLVGGLVARLRYLDAAPFRGAGRALDVGCGNGNHLRRLAALGFRARGLDVSPRAVALCRAAGLDVDEGTLEDARLPAASFDLVVASHVLEHLRDPRAFLAEAARVLAPGGVLVVKTPNADALARRRFGACWYANDPPRHLFVFSGGMLDRLAADAGLHRERGRTFTTPKILLNSRDLQRGARGLPSRKKKLCRLLARPYVWRATLLGRGDELFRVYRR
jgi:SAM-dependent methyltransferase